MIFKPALKLFVIRLCLSNALELPDLVVIELGNSPNISGCKANEVSAGIFQYVILIQGFKLAQNLRSPSPSRVLHAPIVCKDDINGFSFSAIINNDNNICLPECRLDCFNLEELCFCQSLAYYSTDSSLCCHLL